MVWFNEPNPQAGLMESLLMYVSVYKKNNKKVVAAFRGVYHNLHPIFTLWNKNRIWRNLTNENWKCILIQEYALLNTSESFSQKGKTHQICIATITRTKAELLYSHFIRDYISSSFFNLRSSWCYLLDIFYCASLLTVNTRYFCCRYVLFPQLSFMLFIKCWCGT